MLNVKMDEGQMRKDSEGEKPVRLLKAAVSGLHPPLGLVRIQRLLAPSHLEGPNAADGRRGVADRARLEVAVGDGRPLGLGALCNVQHKQERRRQQLEMSPDNRAEMRRNARVRTEPTHFQSPVVHSSLEAEVAAAAALEAFLVVVVVVWTARLRAVVVLKPDEVATFVDFLVEVAALVDEAGLVDEAALDEAAFEDVVEPVDDPFPTLPAA